MKQRGAKENLDAGKIAGRRTKQSTPVDIHIGSRLRQRRTALGMTQEEIATAQGLPYQQVYKYEKAINRISASRLYEFSKTLRVPVAFFFEGIEAVPKARKPKRSKAARR